MSAIDPIAAALKSPDEEVRLQGLRDLASGESLAGLDLIFMAFGDRSWRVRKKAIELFLGLPSNRESIGEIIELLYAEENAGLRNAAVEILTRIGQDALPMLLEHAGCADHDVRKFIIDILGEIAAPAAIPALIHALMDGDSNVRVAAAENLGKLRTEAAVPALLKALQTADLLLQYTILDALSRIAKPVALSELIPYKDEKLLRKALIDCLGKTGDASVISELVAALTDSMRNVREAATLALAEISGRHPEQVKRQLAECEKGPVGVVVTAYIDHADNVSLKRAAIMILGWLGTAEVVEPLLLLIKDESLQQEVLAALVNIGTDNPGALLATWSMVEGNQRACLAYVLGEARCHESLPLLQQGLRDADPQIVSMSAFALGKIGAARMLPDLVACLQSDANAVQESALQALILLGHQFPGETLAALLPLLSHKHSMQRMFAVTVLKELDDPAALEALNLAIKDPAAEVRRAAVKVFERYDHGEHINTLVLSLMDEDVEVRRTVVEVLGRCDSEQALPGLQLALQDEDAWVRSSAVRGFGRVAGEHSRPLLLKALSDPVGLVNIAALETIAGFAGTEACPQMIAALDHNDAEVILSALLLLTRYGEAGWVHAHAEKLLNHPYWAVRVQMARSAVEVLGRSARPMIEARLLVETEAVVCQQLTDLLAELPVS